MKNKLIELLRKLLLPEGAIILTKAEVEALGKYEKKCRMQNAECRMASEVAREIIAIIEQRISTNTERKKGLQSTIWQAHYEGCLQAYTDIKEIIEQKYTEN